eukprot:SAG25_NODE_128_length_14556_cov_11.699405_12_plen_187_part_00
MSQTEAMRTKRKDGGVPPLTYTGMSEEVAHMVITPLLTFLTKKVLEKGYSLRGDDMFSQKILKGNFYEAVAVAVTRGPDVKPHMDRENDWREGHDIMETGKGAGIQTSDRSAEGSTMTGTALTPAAIFITSQRRSNQTEHILFDNFDTRNNIYSRLRARRTCRSTKAITTRSTICKQIFKPHQHKR